LTRKEEMSKSKKMSCSHCEIEFDPEDSSLSHWYEIGGEMYCEDCFKDWVKDYLESNPEDIAKLMNVPVWDVMEKEDY
jgi:hypothetical protein